MGVNTCVNAKIKATAVSVAAGFTVKTQVALQIGLKRYDIIKTSKGS